MAEIDRVAHALCQSRAYETGEGACAVLCMEQLGSARGRLHGCAHARRIHGRAAEAVLKALSKDEQEEGVA